MFTPSADPDDWRGSAEIFQHKGPDGNEVTAVRGDFKANSRGRLTKIVERHGQRKKINGCQYDSIHGTWVARKKNNEDYGNGKEKKKKKQETQKETQKIKRKCGTELDCAEIIQVLPVPVHMTYIYM